MPVNYGGILGGFVNTEEALADITGKKLLNQVNEYKLRSAMQGDQEERASRLALQEAQAKLDQKRMKGLGPGAVSPDPASVAESEGSDKPWSAGDPVGMPGSGAPEAKLSDLHQQEYDQAQAFAAAMAKAGNNKAHEKYLKDSDLALSKATAAKKEERIQEAEKFKNLLNFVTGANDEFSINETVKAVKAQYPDAEKIMQQMGFARGPDGRYLWEGSDNPKKIKSLKENLLNEIDRRKREDKDQDQDQRRLEAEDRRVARQQAQAAVDIANDLRRQGLQQTAEFRKAEQERKDEKLKETKTKEVQRGLEKDPVYKDFPKAQMAFDQAKNTIKTLSDPRGFQNFNASDARALSSTFSNISEGFRARVGGKYALQDIEKFNGLYQKFDKWVESFGRGTPTLSAATARDMANTITEIYDIWNKNAVIASLEGKELAVKKGGAPDEIRIRGDIGRLGKTGQARIEEIDGKRYLVIGRKGQQEVRFEHKAEDD